MNRRSRPGRRIRIVRTDRGRILLEVLSPASRILADGVRMNGRTKAERTGRATRAARAAWATTAIWIRMRAKTRR